MELKTESGVSITIIEGDSSAILAFDRSVRAVELSKAELSKIKAFLSPSMNTNSIDDDCKPSKKKAAENTALEEI